MTVIEKIQQYIQKLPASFQSEILDYVEYLFNKVEHDTIRREEKVWSDLSLTFAMHGMENEDAPAYTTSDLKVVF